MVSSRRAGLRLDMLRAGLGCLLVFLQARTALDSQRASLARSSLQHDWGFVTAVVCHIAWLFCGSWKSENARFFSCAARVAPKLAMLGQLVIRRAVPATAGWFNDDCWQRHRWCWRAMAEVFVYSCGELPTTLIVPASVLDIICTVLIWASLYARNMAHPALAGLAHISLRLVLSVGVHCCQQRTTASWLRRVWTVGLASRRGTSHSVKVDANHNPTLLQTSVHSSVVCCSNPTILSRIVATSAKDLEPVRLERLSASGSCVGLGHVPPDEPAGDVGTEAYELARRLVSSAGGNGSIISSGSGSGYTSSARKVRVSVKIPDRSPQDLPPGWDANLRINGQHESALVLFTYMRRGCIQLVLDFLGHAQAGNLLAVGTSPCRLLNLPIQASSTLQVPNTGSGDPGPKGGAQGPELQSAGTATGSSCSAVSCDALKARPGSPPGTDGCRTDCQPASAWATQAGAAHVVAEKLLRAVGGESLVAGRTITVQFGPDVRLLRFSSSSSSGAEGAEAAGCLPAGDGCCTAAPQLPPNVHVQPRVVCTSGAAHWWHGHFAQWGWAPGQQRLQEVLLSCWWDASDGSEAAPCADAPGTCSAQDPPADWPSSAHPSPGLQLSVRQQGSFLPVVLHGGPGCTRLGGSEAAAVRSALAAGEVAVAVDNAPCLWGPRSCPGPVAGDTGKGAESAAAVDAAFAGCSVAFSPAKGEGLVQVELSRGGVHSAASTAVLLVSSPAVAFELGQLQAIAPVKLESCCSAADTVDCVLRDFGTFLDIVPAVRQTVCIWAGVREDEAEEEDSLHMPMFQWSAVPPSVMDLDTAPVPVDVFFFTSPQALGRSPVACAGSSEAGAAAAGTTECTGSADRKTPTADYDHCRRRLLTLGSLGSRLGMNLLRYFLSCGMEACATRTLDILHTQLGLPAQLVAGYVCPEGLTLLHHAARSGSFRSLAGIADWLEVRGADPDLAACDAVGLTPLHLAAVVPNGAAAVALVRLRWPAVRRAWWHRSAAARKPRDCRASPADFAAMAQEPGGAWYWQQRAAEVARALGVGAGWRCAAAAWRHTLPHGWVWACRDVVAPALGFSLPSLERLYESWLTRRTILVDHCFLALYCVYCISQACRQPGWLFVKENFPGLVLAAVRLSLLACGSPVWQLLQQACPRLAAWSRVRSPEPAGRTRPWAEQPGPETTDGKNKSCDGDGCSGFASAAAPVPSRAPCSLVAMWISTREGRAVFLECVRLVVMLILAWGRMPIPRSWRAMVELRLDLMYNILLRPTAEQMRVLPTAVASAVAVVGESAITAVLLRAPGNAVSATETYAKAVA